MVDRVFKSSDALVQGRLKRYNLRHELDNHSTELFNVVYNQQNFDSGFGTLNDQILEELEANNKGIISNSDLIEAVNKVVSKRNLNTNPQDLHSLVNQIA